MSVRRRLVIALVCAASIVSAPLGADEAHYRTPPRAILDVLNAPPLPVPFVATSRDWLLLATPLRYPPIADLAWPMLRLAGMRIDPANNGIHHASSYTAYALVRISDGKRIEVKLPANARAGPPVWNPDGTRFAFSNAAPRAIELYVAATSTGAIRKVPNVRLNALFGNTIAWTPDGKRILTYLVPNPVPSPAPREPASPSGPVVDETTRTNAPAVTYEDLLKNPHDADVWEYYAQGQYAFVDPRTGFVSVLHGAADDNTGTFPIQSERLFAAIKGNGGTARLVMLPYEAHGYVAHESIQTTLAEMLDWLDRYVTNAPPRPAAQRSK